MTISWKSDLRKLKDLKDYKNNPRKMEKEPFKKLVESLKSDGYHQRLLINIDGTIIGGHARKKALLKAGYKEESEIEVLVPDRLLTGEDFDRVNIRDNLPYGSFDFDMLANMFEPEQLIEWGMPEDWLQLDVEEIEAEEGDNDVPEIPEEPITKLGDIWQLGEHRLMCGNSVSITDVDKLIDGAVIDFAYIDPPYGVDFVSSGSNTKNKYEDIIGDDSIQTAIDSYSLCKSISIPIMIFWGANYYASSLPNTKSWIVWDKQNTGVYSDCELAWTNADKVTKLFKHMWNGCVKDSERKERRVHPTQKPIELALYCFNEYAPDSKTVLDLFGGSGSTLVACERSKRKCFMMELSPNYCDVIIKRWETMTKDKAILLNDTRGE
jgi:DNA modification methylase